jgi:hypothetical protein
MVEVLEFPPIPVSDLLKRIRDDLTNIYLRDDEEIQKAWVELKDKKRFAGTQALQELGTIMYNLGVKIGG